MDITRYLSDDMNRSRCPGLQFNDLASLLCGVKSVVYLSVGGRREWRQAQELCADLKLKLVTLGAAKDISGGRITDILIGTSSRKLAAAAKAYANVCSLEWGLALDYPECCVRAYLAWRAAQDGADLITRTWERTPRGVLVPFWMNNVLNFFSRIVTARDRKDYAAFSRLNAGLDREAIITWHPCSYACPETLEKGRRLYEFLARHMPRTAAARRGMLSKPVLFWDKFRFAFLNGSCRVGAAGAVSAAYSGLSLPRSLLGAGTAAQLGARGAIAVSRDARLAAPRGLRLPEGFSLIPFFPG